MVKGEVVRNVAGLLRGSDPALADTYVILSAHYDHLGMRHPLIAPATEFTMAPTTMAAARFR